MVGIKKLIVIITSIVSSVLAGLTIFLIVFFSLKKKDQPSKDHDTEDISLAQEITNLKKENEQLLAQIPTIKKNDWNSYVDEFYSEEEQKVFQEQKNNIKTTIDNLKTDVTCHQKDLKEQKQCWLTLNHDIKNY